MINPKQLEAAAREALEREPGLVEMPKRGLWPNPETEGPLPPGIRSITEIKPLSAYAGRAIDYVVEDTFAVGTVNLISGDSGSGKTTFASAVCSAVRRGAPFAGLATQRRPVLILDRENPLSVVSERFERLGIVDGPNFFVWGGWCEDEPADPGSPIITEWVSSFKEQKPLILIDSLVAFMRGDENSATEARAYMQRLRRLADMGATIIVLHHSGKAETSKDFRGSSDIKASIDVGYHLSNLGDPSRLGVLRLRAFKARFAVRQDLVIRYSGGAFSMDARGPILTVYESLQGLLVEQPRVTSSEFEQIAGAKGIGSHKARQFLKDGIAAGTVLVSRGDHGAKHHTWKGSPDSEEQAFVC